MANAKPMPTLTAQQAKDFQEDFGLDEIERCATLLILAEVITPWVGAIHSRNLLLALRRGDSETRESIAKELLLLAKEASES